MNNGHIDYCESWLLQNVIQFLSLLDFIFVFAKHFIKSPRNHLHHGLLKILNVHLRLILRLKDLVPLNQNLEILFQNLDLLNLRQLDTATQIFMQFFDKFCVKFIQRIKIPFELPKIPIVLVVRLADFFQDALF